MPHQDGKPSRVGDHVRPGFSAKRRSSSRGPPPRTGRPQRPYSTRDTAFWEACRPPGASSATLPEVGLAHGAASIPILSLKATAIRCVRPRYRSVVWTETWPRKLDLLQFATGGSDIPVAERPRESSAGQAHSSTCRRARPAFPEIISVSSEITSILSKSSAISAQFRTLRAAQAKSLTCTAISHDAARRGHISLSARLIHVAKRRIFAHALRRAGGAPGAMRRSAPAARCRRDRLSGERNSGPSERRLSRCMRAAIYARVPGHPAA